MEHNGHIARPPADLKCLEDDEAIEQARRLGHGIMLNSGTAVTSSSDFPISARKETTGEKIDARGDEPGKPNPIGS